MKPSTFLALVVLGCGLFAACSTIDRAYDQEVVPVATNVTTGVVTYTTNLVAKPAVTTGLTIVESIPHPYATLGGMVLSLVYAGYLGFRNSRNKKAAKAVIAGTQSYKETLGDKEREKLVEALVDAQEASGTRPVVNELRGK